VALFSRSLGPALAAGNTVAAKLPGQTALTNALVAEIVSKAPSLPVGVVNMFTESGNTGAPFLIESADVDMVSFTGSIEVGRLIAAAGAKTLKRMNLELGGKTPMIVFDDASLASILPLSAASVTTLCRPELHGGLADRRPARHRHDEKDAIERANATEFGLAAGVFTRDVDRTRRLSRQINAGTVWTQHVDGD
jgi:acyl-CoA reductase-like NAD-dependent aldehyde dehydrogenase